MQKAAQRLVSAFQFRQQPEFSAEKVLESFAESVLAIDLDGRIQYLNDAAKQQFALGQLPEPEELANDLLLQMGAVSRYPVKVLVQQFSPLPTQGVTSFCSLDGKRQPVTFVAHPIPGAGNEIVGFVFRIHGRDERSTMLRSLLHDATHDELTGLVNRRELISRLRRLIRRRRFAEQHALFFMDLDKFKQINDTCGHRAGDEALRRIARLLRSKIRNRDTLGRLGGDEFVLLMEHCPEEKAIQTAALLSNAVRDYTFVWGGKAFRCGLSIGMVPLVGSKGDAEALLAEAEAACYEAKKTHGAHPAIFRRHRNIFYPNPI